MFFTTRQCLAAGALVVATQAVPAFAQSPQAASTERAPGSSGQFDGYDFGQVVEQMQASVSPLQRQMNDNFRAFTEQMQEAEMLLDEDRPREAIEVASGAIRGVLEVRDSVLEPMWEGQAYLAEQLSDVRERLSEAIEASGSADTAALDTAAEQNLDRIAERIAGESDPTRKQRLVAHYRTVRDIARIKQLERRLTPDERKLWSSVLTVLEQAATAHQQVLMGSELLFAQLEATAGSLDDYLGLLETVEGARQLLGMVEGVGESADGMASFAERMGTLQQRLGGFNDAVRRSLESSMIGLESQVEGLQPLTASDGVDGAGIDDELMRRLDRVSGP
ncbi:MAG: hypothetical protein AAGI37_15360 [Planctomycetota bacterium]